MKSRNQRLAIVLILLIGLNAGIFFSSDLSDTNLNTELFAMPPHQVESVKITYADEAIEAIQLERKEESWLINGTHPADRGIINVLLAVLPTVRVKRELGEEEKSNLEARLRTEGRLVEVSGVSNMTFRMGANPTRTKTFYWDEQTERAYEVEIPGYTDFVGGIFMLTPQQWRDRTVFSGNARTIESLKINRGETPGLDIKFENRFFRIEGISAIDTTKLVDYLNGYVNLQANERISAGDYPQYDSLAKINPMAEIEIQDIAKNAPFKIKIFPPLPGDNIHLVIDNEGEMMVFDKRRINQMLKKPSDFSH